MNVENAREMVVYDAPRVERVLTSEELTREVQYAGDIVSLSTDNQTG